MPPKKNPIRKPKANVRSAPPPRVAAQQDSDSEDNEENTDAPHAASGWVSAAVSTASRCWTLACVPISLVRGMIFKKKKVLDKTRLSYSQRQRLADLERAVHEAENQLAETNVIIAEKMAIKAKQELIIDQRMAVLQDARNEYTAEVDSVVPASSSMKSVLIGMALATVVNQYPQETAGLARDMTIAVAKTVIHTLSPTPGNTTLP